MQPSSQAPYDEPVLESAPLAARLATELCGTDPDTGESCAWNHGFWQYLRVLGLVTTPAHHWEFFRRGFDMVDGGGGQPRVLISAAADYSMLVQVLRAFAARNVTPRVSVVDVCGTPLALNEWYAKRAGVAIECSRANILDYHPDAPYDVVCSHAFLGQFPPSSRPELTGKWRDLLRPGGLAVTVNRIRPDGGPGRTGFTTMQAQGFCAAVAREAEQAGHQLKVAPAELARMAAEYAARQSGYSVTRIEEVAELFETAGFSLAHLTSAVLAPSAGARLGGPTTPGGVEFACVIAERP